MKQTEQTKLSCTVCGKSPDEGIHVSGIKFIKGKEEPYNICKMCCLGTGNISYSDQGEYRKKLWDKVEKKIRERKKK